MHPCPSYMFVKMLHFMQFLNWLIECCCIEKTHKNLLYTNCYICYIWIFIKKLMESLQRALSLVNQSYSWYWSIKKELFFCSKAWAKGFMDTIPLGFPAAISPMRWMLRFGPFGKQPFLDLYAMDLSWYSVLPICTKYILNVSHKNFKTSGSTPWGLPYREFSLSENS